MPHSVGSAILCSYILAWKRAHAPTHMLPCHTLPTICRDAAATLLYHNTHSCTPSCMAQPSSTLCGAPLAALKTLALQSTTSWAVGTLSSVCTSTYSFTAAAGGSGKNAHVIICKTRDYWNTHVAGRAAGFARELLEVMALRR